MKTICAILFFLIVPFLVFSQPKTEYPIELPAYNMGSISEYTIQATVLESNAYKYTISKVAAPDKKREFTLRPNNFDDFQKNAKSMFANLIAQEEADPEKAELNRILAGFDADNTYKLIYFRFISSEMAIDSHDYRPIAGELFFGKTVGIVFEKGTANSKITSASITNIEIEFNEGYIENIKVIVEIGKGIVKPEPLILKFENNYAIGFSTKRDFNLIQNIKLFSFYEDATYSIDLRQVLERFEETHAVGRRDYSPADQVITFDVKKETKLSIQLAKETTAKLFELKTYSDFVGFDQNSPNGLIQFEVDKRLNLRTQRRNIVFSPRSTWAFGQFITPFITLSKLEENNKHLVLNYRDQFTNNEYTPQRFTSTLELKRFENFRVGADLNLFILDFPSVKSTFYLNAGFRYGRVAIRDSLRTFENDAVKLTQAATDYGVDTYTISPVKLLWEVKTDERYTFSLGWSTNLLYLRDNSFIQVASIPTYNDSGDVGNYRYVNHNVLLLMSFKPQPESNGRLFFRYQFNWQHGYWRTGFHQAQVGYAVYLTKQLKPDRKE